MLGFISVIRRGGHRCRSDPSLRQPRAGLA